MLILSRIPHAPRLQSRLGLVGRHWRNSIRQSSQLSVQRRIARVEGSCDALQVKLHELRYPGHGIRADHGGSASCADGCRLALVLKHLEGGDEEERDHARGLAPHGGIYSRKGNNRASTSARTTDSRSRTWRSSPVRWSRLGSAMLWPRNGELLSVMARSSNRSGYELLSNRNSDGPLHAVATKGQCGHTVKRMLKQTTAKPIPCRLLIGVVV